MRIRRKKHLEERLNKAKQNLILSDFDILNVNEAILDKKLLDFETIFANGNPVNMEIGCGKGGFAIKKALLTPSENFIAVELLSNIIVMASEAGIKAGATNLKFFNCGADYLPRYIKEGSISNIYLNFSPPFPGDRYINRRLTKNTLIKDYTNFLVKGGKIWLKTDDKEFYDYSFNQLQKFGYYVENTTKKVLDGELENVETEYEMKFKKLNLPIHYLMAVKNHD